MSIGLESSGWNQEAQVGWSEPFPSLPALQHTMSQEFTPFFCGNFVLETPCHHLHRSTHFQKNSGVFEVWFWKKEKNTCSSFVFLYPLCSFLVASHSLAGPRLNWLQIKKGKEMQQIILPGMGDNVKDSCLCSLQGSNYSNFACYCPYIKCVSYNS